MTQRWAILRPNEDGQHFRLLRDPSMRHMLAWPEEYGIKRFVTLDELDPDPAVWEPGTAVLLRVEVVVPEPAGGFALPEYAE
jgi:hypothetical protein